MSNIYGEGEYLFFYILDFPLIPSPKQFIFNSILLFKLSLPNIYARGHNPFVTIPKRSIWYLSLLTCYHFTGNRKITRVLFINFLFFN